jgi:hypothetical protein
MSLSDDIIYLPATSAVVCELGDGLALLDSRTNRYFGLNAVGAIVWGALNERQTPKAIAVDIAREFGVDVALVLVDVMLLIADLAKEQLVEPLGRAAALANA